MKQAIVLLSGGLDSAVTLYYARQKGYNCLPLFFEYGQRHARESRSAASVARSAGLRLKKLKIALPWKGSSLLDRKMKLPAHFADGAIPSTYVPARNIIFLSFALSYAEASGADAIFIGAHAQDYSGYPDCRPQFYRAFAQVARAGTKSGVEGRGIKIVTPLLDKGKAGIIRLGVKLKVPFQLTWSCYQGGAHPCGECDSCRFRAKGFKEAGVADPLLKR